MNNCTSSVPSGKGQVPTNKTVPAQKPAMPLPGKGLQPIEEEGGEMEVYELKNQAKLFTKQLTLL
jgi:hypothetical protein